MTPPAPAGAPPPQQPEEAGTAALEDAVGLAFRVLQGVMLLIALLFVGSGMFTVGPNQVAFVRRLGRLDPTPHGPGAHLAWPVIDEVQRVDVGTTTVTVTGAFDVPRTAHDLATGRVRREGGIDPRRAGYLVTGDANLVHGSPAARTKVQRAHASLHAFTDEDREAALLALLERAVVHAGASRPIDALLAGKGEFTAEVQRTLQESLDGVRPHDQPAGEPLGAGLEVQGVDLERDLVPPSQVKDAFDAVHQASQDQDRLRSEALAAAARTRGDAAAAEARVRSEARGRADALRAGAEADAAVFAAQLPERRRDPQGYVHRRVATTLAEALRQVEEAFLLRPGPLRVRVERDVRTVREGLVRDAARAEGVAPPGPEKGR